MASTEEEEDAERDNWEECEGYTPLQHLNSTNGGAVPVVLSMGLGSGGGAFYSDMSAFTCYQGDDDDSDNNNEEFEQQHEGKDAGVEQGANEYGALSTDNDDFDFRAVAESALMSLEDEYRITLQRESNDAGAGCSKGMDGTVASKSASATEEADDEEEEPLNLPPVRLPAEDFGSDFFVTNFDDINLEQSAQGAPPPKPIPDIDADGVQRAVQSIHLKDPNLDNKLSEWEALQMEKLVTAPRLHSIIPSIPLKAFHKKTEKAIQATANLSRSATIAEALRRLDLLQSQDYFQIDVVGCDHVECSSEDRLRQLFGPITRWIGNYPESPKHLKIRVIGPNVPPNAPKALEFTTDLARLTSAELVCLSGLYEECPNSDNNTANLRIAFNAGVWGYREWRTTIKHLAIQKREIPFIITAYTLQEAEDDAEVIREELTGTWDADAAKAACIFEPELNSLASKQERQTSTALPGRRYRENGAWQGWRV